MGLTQAALLRSEQLPELGLMVPKDRSGPIASHGIRDECRVAGDRIRPHSACLESGRVVDGEPEPTEEGAEAIGTRIPGLWVPATPQQRCRRGEDEDDDAVDLVRLQATTEREVLV